MASSYVVMVGVEFEHIRATLMFRFFAYFPREAFELERDSVLTAEHGDVAFSYVVAETLGLKSNRKLRNTPFCQNTLIGHYIKLRNPRELKINRLVLILFQSRNNGQRARKPDNVQSQTCSRCPSSYKPLHTFLTCKWSAFRNCPCLF